MTEVRLTVDGEEVNLIDTIRLLQRDPWPGGHRYRLTIAGQALSVFDRFGIGDSRAVRSSDQAAVLFAVGAIAARMPGEGQIPARFIVNTVDQVTSQHDRVFVSGVCSIPTE